MTERARGRSRYERRSQARAQRIQRRLEQAKQPRTRTTSELPKRLRGAMPARSRAHLTGVALFAGSLMLGALLASSVSGTTLFWWSDEPAVLAAIAVQGNERLPGSAVAMATGLAKGSSLDAVADSFEEQVEARVATHPWIRSARIALLPTGTLIVDVEERQPRAVIREAVREAVREAKDDSWLFVDAEGVVFAPVTGHEAEASTLPALAWSEPAAGGQEGLLRDGLTLLTHLNSLSLLGLAWGEAPHRGLELRLPVAGSGRGWVLFGHAPDLEVILGSEDVATVIDRLDRLERLLAAGLEEVGRSRMIDMRFAGQAVLQELRASG
jgi:hypothetical protein